MSNQTTLEPSVASYNPQGSYGKSILITPPAHKGNIYIYIYIYIYIINLRGFASILEPIFDILISWRGPCVNCKRKPFLRHTTDGDIDHWEGNDRHLVGMKFRSNL